MPLRTKTLRENVQHEFSQEKPAYVAGVQKAARQFILYRSYEFILYHRYEFLCRQFHRHLVAVTFLYTYIKIQQIVVAFVYYLKISYIVVEFVSNN